MFVVDTNIFLYAAERSFSEHSRCRDLLLDYRQSPSVWFSTWGILYEFLRVVTHPRVFQHPWKTAKAWQFVESVLASESLRLLTETSRHSEVAAQTLAEMPYLSANIMHDAHTAIIMREHGISRIVTRDADFYRFSFLEVIDPLKEMSR